MIFLVCLDFDYSSKNFVDDFLKLVFLCYQLGYSPRAKIHRALWEIMLFFMVMILELDWDGCAFDLEGLSCFFVFRVCTTSTSSIHTSITTWDPFPLSKKTIKKWSWSMARCARERLELRILWCRCDWCTKNGVSYHGEYFELWCLVFVENIFDSFFCRIWVLYLLSLCVESGDGLIGFCCLLCVSSDVLVVLISVCFKSIPYCLSCLLLYALKFCFDFGENVWCLMVVFCYDVFFLQNEW